jgi:hypothetical protein
LKLSGYCPEEKDRLNICNNGSDTRCFTICRVLIGTLKGPDVFLEFNFSISDSISFIVIFSSLNLSLILGGMKSNEDFVVVGMDLAKSVPIFVK